MVAKLGIAVGGLGAVSSTLMAGLALARRRGLPLIGSALLDLHASRLGGGPPSVSMLPKIEWLAWDIRRRTAADALREERVLEPSDLRLVRGEMDRVSALPGFASPRFTGDLRREQLIHEGRYGGVVDQLREDLRDFRKRSGSTDNVFLWLGSCELAGPAPGLGMKLDRLLATPVTDDCVPPSVLYAIAALLEGFAVCDCTPSTLFDARAVRALILASGIPAAGKDLRTGQTYLKTVLAPGLRMRSLGLHGWYSHNILGNSDGRVLADPRAREGKIESKGSVLESILDRDEKPWLYGKHDHRVTIEYYPLRGDSKEAWEVVDFFGWCGYPMQLRMQMNCRDSILAAPLVLDCALGLALARRAGRKGMQDWLSFYFKSRLAGEAPRLGAFEEFEQLLRTASTLLSRQGRGLMTGEPRGGASRTRVRRRAGPASLGDRHPRRRA